MKTLAFIKAHNFTKQLVLEYKKMIKSDVDVLIVFDNKFHDYTPAENSNITYYNYMGEELPVLFTDMEMFQKFNLPGFYDNKKSCNINRFMWYNADYQVYIVRKLFPDYDYYWQIEYDVFCNGESYQKFFDTYKDSTSDLIATRYARSTDEWWAVKKTDWVYDKTVKACCILPIIRVSSRAADYLYKRRLEFAPLYEKNSRKKNVRWAFCELFVATEVFNHQGMSGEPLKEQFIETPDIKMEIPKEYDDKLYHPIKLVEELDGKSEKYVLSFPLY